MPAARHVKKRSRKPPCPNSVLDRKALVRALDQAGLTVKALHIEAFYQALHRQHYPNLSDFVDNYYRHEDEHRKLLPNNTKRSDVPQRPLKNSISNKKNKNKMQLPRSLLQFLKETNDLITVTSTVVQAQTSADGTTTKLAIRLHDGQLVESVLMRYVTRDGSRASLCVSSQCGCAMGCTFCATGTMGLSGSLTTGEILEQVVHADRILGDEWRERNLSRQQENSPENANAANPKKNEQLKLDLVRNIVFMGMGEPLDNYTNVVEACRALINRKRWNFAHGKVTVSTVGLPAQMRKFTADLPEVCMALSLHAPNQQMRSAIVPTAQHYPIEDLIDALDSHMMAYLRKRMPSDAIFSQEQRIQESARRRAMIEYVMLEGATSSLECAHQLGKLCEHRHLVVNLIPYNQTDVQDTLRCPTEEHMNEFRRIVSSYGAFCTIRRTMGADIASACGQLITLKKKEEHDGTVRDIEDAGDTQLRPRPASSGLGEVSTVSSVRKVVDKSTPEEVKEVNLDGWVGPLAVATAVAASCFVTTSYLFLRQHRRR